MKLNDITRGTGLEADGINNANLIYRTPPTSVLYEQIVIRGEGLLSHLGAVAVKTGHAKIINLSKEAEPEIYETTRRFGTVLENVAIDTHTRRVDLADDSLTENTRASYPLTHIPNVVKSGCGGHPATIIMLTCDAFGVLPPIARLTPEQAMFQYLG